jgi:hypothetical protein
MTEKKGMTIEEAVRAVVKHIRQTGEGQTESIRALWNNELSGLSPEAKTQLAQEGLQPRVALALRNGLFSDEPAVQHVKVTVREVPPAVQHVKVTVTEMPTEKQVIKFTVVDGQ